MMIDTLGLVAGDLVGVLYCTNESNSLIQYEAVKALFEAAGIVVEAYTFSETTELQTVVTNMASKVKAVYVPSDNTVADNTSVIDGICEPAGVPVIAGEEGICSGCGVATLSISYYDLGYATGLMAVKILRDGADVSAMPIEYAATQTKKYNEQNCNALGITPLAGYVKIDAE